MHEPQRIKAFRQRIIREIPRFPNDRSSLKVLEAKSLGSLLIDYLNWASRYIAPRPREVVFDMKVAEHPRWLDLSTELVAVLDKVRRGDVLTPYLSTLPHTRGFTPASSEIGPTVDRWTDKDFVLNAMGYHHLHFDEMPHDNRRSNDLIFAFVDREKFEIIGIFDHKAFKYDSASKTMSDERQRLWEAFDGHTSRDIPPGSVYISTLIATSGHPVHLVRYASACARTIYDADPMLDDPAWVHDLYEKSAVSAPSRPKIKWHFHCSDLGLLDEAAGIFFCLRPGFN